MDLDVSHQHNYSNDMSIISNGPLIPQASNLNEIIQNYEIASIASKVN